MRERDGEVAAALARAGRFHPAAERALADEAIGRSEAHALLACPDVDLESLLWAAFAVRVRHHGRRVKLCILNNARSGLCPEDCGYCSQSAVSTAAIDKYRLKDVEVLAAAADAAVAAGARRYCMVTSARGPSARDVLQLARAARRIRAAHPDLELCVSLGLMEEVDATTLRTAGIDYVNHNLNTSRRFYSEICSTHTYDDRVATVVSAKRAGMRICSGVIIGMGETDEDLVDVAGALADLEVESLPVNFLHPIDGTPLGDREPPDAGRCLRALALFRLTNPRAEIRAAGGREKALAGIEGLALFAANSIFVDGYLTTPGQTRDAATRMIEDLGFEIDRDGRDVTTATAG
jgi:biotin synthase